MVEAARRAFALRVRDAEVADVVENLTVAQGDSPGVRLVRFSAGELGIGVVACLVGEAFEVFLDVHPPASCAVEVRHGGLPTTARTDAHGRAELHDVLPGPFSVVVERPAGGGRVQTSWICL